jgi:sigma-B regulation protein RsbU (phosphoserine phosphatase)
MGSGARVMLFGVAGVPGDRISNGLRLRGVAAQNRPLSEALDSRNADLPDIAVLALGETPDPTVLAQAGTVLDRLVAGGVVTLVWGGSESLRYRGGPLVEWLDPQVSADELVGRLSTLAQYVPLVHQLEHELEQMRRLGDQIQRYLSEIDQEMRLAGRLQRDFLPRNLPRLPGFDCAALYRPASWVSGDLYDIFTLGPQQAGIFLADAMGHGVAAGLLTMFLRQALLAQRAAPTGAVLEAPAKVLAHLHASLARQRLANCQFVTAVYAVLDASQNRLRLARAGHPYPIHIGADGRIEPVIAVGSILGLPDLVPDFQEVQVALSPGDKIIFFTDGLERELLASQAVQPPIPSAELQQWAGLPAQDLVQAVGQFLDRREGSLHPGDDVTLLVLEATGPSAS